MWQWKIILFINKISDMIFLIIWAIATNFLINLTVKASFLISMDISNSMFLLTWLRTTFC
jgi:hypothetical protein